MFKGFPFSSSADVVVTQFYIYQKVPASFLLAASMTYLSRRHFPSTFVGFFVKIRSQIVFFPWLLFVDLRASYNSLLAAIRHFSSTTDQLLRLLHSSLPEESSPGLSAPRTCSQ